MKRRRAVISGILTLGVFLCLVTFAFLAAQFALHSPLLQTYIAAFGYGGAVGISYIAGLNVLVPLPIATLTPLFTAAGLAIPGLILSFTIGTILADFTGYFLGRIGRETIRSHHPRIVRALEKIYHEHKLWLIPGIFLYVAFVPLPNEVIVIPLALLGMRWNAMLIPLLLGNLVNQTIYAYGIQNIFQWIF